jgi:hypothetical protein
MAIYASRQKLNSSHDTVPCKRISKICWGDDTSIFCRKLDDIGRMQVKHGCQEDLHYNYIRRVYLWIVFWFVCCSIVLFRFRLANKIRFVLFPQCDRERQKSYHFTVEHKQIKYLLSVLRIRIRDPVLFWPHGTGIRYIWNLCYIECTLVYYWT